MALVVFNGKSSLKYLINANAPQISVFNFSYHTSMILLTISSVVIYADDNTVCSKCDRKVDMLQ